MLKWLCYWYKLLCGAVAPEMLLCTALTKIKSGPGIGLLANITSITLKDEVNVCLMWFLAIDCQEKSI